MIKPITPNEAKNREFPDFVIGAFNHCIQKNMGNTLSTVKQNEVIAEILVRSPSPISRQTIFDNRWLDVEDVYRRAGWKVNYDKPGWNEDYEAYFEFRIKESSE